MKLFRDILTGADNVTFDLLRVGTAIGLLVYFGATFYAIAAGTKFDWVAFGGGLGAVLAASGAGIGLKKDTEPKP